MNRREVIRTAFAALASAGLPMTAASAKSAYPDRPIKLIVPFPPGGVVDLVARLWAQQMQSKLGTIAVVNRGGASGAIGSLEVAHALPDGYTLLLGNTSTQLLDPVFMPHPTYDAEKDFKAIGIVATSAVAIAVNPKVPVHNLPELVAYLKKNIDKVSYASAGVGTYTNLAGEMFKKSAGLPNLKNIPYRGGGPLITDVVSGRVPMMMINVTSGLVALQDANKLRVIAVFAPKRVQLLPNVQTATETYPDLVASLFFGVFAPAATPKSVIDRLAQANHSVMSDAKFQAKLIATGFEPVVDTPEEAQRFLREESARVIPLARSVGHKY
jgi:tripartite-type tricarboxylate transporter receptor subunit TctC